MVPPDFPATFETFQAELARLLAYFDRDHPTYTAPTFRADILDDFLGYLKLLIRSSLPLLFAGEPELTL